MNAKEGHVAPARPSPDGLPFTLSVEAVLQVLETAGNGLSEEEVVRRRAHHGYNELAETPPVPAWRKFLWQFKELVIWILMVAALLAGFMGEWADTAAILAIVLVNAILGFLQEERAERALAALRKLSAPQAKVVRDGVRRTLPACELVPGDRIELEAGDQVPADARLTVGFGVQALEAALTGESVPVGKDPDCVLNPATPLGDRRNMVFMGTVVASGQASAVVVTTGMQTELGRIAGMLGHPDPEPTPLQRRLAELGKVLAVVCVVMAAFIFLLEMLRGRPLVDVLLLSVSLAVAAVPEGLPAVVTVTLTVGLQRMARRNALVRRLPSVETLGCVTVICSDKTGTLTRNEMTVREIVAGGRHYSVTGGGYTPQGQFLHSETGDSSAENSGVSPHQSTDFRVVDPSAEPDLVLALSIGARCNNARVVPGGNEGAWQVIGDPTEGALVVAALKAGLEETAREESVLHAIPFDSERKAMSVVLGRASGAAVMYTKGAPEVVLAKCAAERCEGRTVALTQERRAAVLRTCSAFAAKALRVLALACREYADGEEGDYAENDLVFVGLAGMMDPPREEVKEAVRRAREAGIRPIMITGDHPATALAVARELGIAVDSDRALTGAELDSLSEHELTARVELVSVYARVSAAHKLRVVRAWQDRGQVVAMTGDGVNDAPAVQAADIGIAMGLSGTDVTKEASDMVLTDDNFASIINAVEEGRGIFDNIQKFLHYLLAGNIGLVLFVLVAALAGWPFPLTATQILWINLVTNGLPALALGMEPPERDLMRRPPRPPREPVLTARRGLLMLGHGALLAAVTALGFFLAYRGEPENLPRARTVAFCLVSYAFIFYAFSCRSLRYTMPELGLFTNPYLFGAVALSGLLQLSVILLPFARPMFEAAAHPVREWGLIAMLSLAPVTVIEATKLVLARLRSRALMSEQGAANQGEGS